MILMQREPKTDAPGAERVRLPWVKPVSFPVQMIVYLIVAACGAAILWGLFRLVVSIVR